MVELSIEDIWMNPEPWETRATPLPPQPIDGAEEASWSPKTRFASRPSCSLSAKATLVSVVTLGALGAGALMAMHSLAHSGEPLSASLGVAELPAAAAPVATPAPNTWPPTSFAPATWTPGATTSRTAAAAPIATPTPTAVTARIPRARARPPPPRIVIYPFPVPPPSMRGEQVPPDDDLLGNRE
jgi:hypothetical protein